MYTTPFVVFSEIYYLDLHCAITFYYRSSFIPTKVQLVAWTFQSIKPLLKRNYTTNKML